jgi:hypothetical protein
MTDNGGYLIYAQKGGGVSAFHDGIAHFGLDPFFAFLRAALGFLVVFFFARAGSRTRGPLRTR